MKKCISFYVAALVGKAMIHGMHLMKRNATNLPGEAALKLCPQLLSQFQMPKNVILVTGTNGKTTVTNLIGNALKKRGNTLITTHSAGTSIQDCLAAACKFQFGRHPACRYSAVGNGRTQCRTDSAIYAAVTSFVPTYSGIP